MDTQTLTQEDIIQILRSRELDGGVLALADLPKPQSLKGTDEGARIVCEAMRDNKEILVIGDYDADGVCASAIMSLFFNMLGYKHFRLIIPHRFTDGYGVSAALLDKHAKNAAVIVSVDNGITAFCAGEWCRARQIPFIITDHHTPMEMTPQADVIINPMLADSAFMQKNICGAVVAWYFCGALKHALGAKIDMGGFLTYLAIATIADIMPLVGINRMLVKKGLEHLLHSRSAFATLLRMEFAKTKKLLNAQNLAFDFIPLLNCAGRMDSADRALAFLLATDMAHATALYEELKGLNQQRKAIQHEVAQKARENLILRDDFVLSYGEGWHEGVLGIVAAQLAREYKKSAFVLNKTHDVLKGSGRSYGGVNLIASITPLREYCIGLGGHSGAVGLSIEAHCLQAFVKELGHCMVYEEVGEEGVLGKLEAGSVNMELFKILESFEPFGEGNPQPIFLIENLTLHAIKPLKNNQHFEYTLVDAHGVCLMGLEFFAPKILEVGQNIDIRAEIIRDCYRQRIGVKILEVIER